MKSQIAGVKHAAQLGSDLEIGAGIKDEDARIHVIRLPFDLAGAQVGKKALWSSEGDLRTRERDLLPVEEAEDAAREGLRLGYGIEPAGNVVARVGVARGK